MRAVRHRKHAIPDLWPLAPDHLSLVTSHSVRPGRSGDAPAYWPGSNLFLWLEDEPRSRACSALALIEAAPPGRNPVGLLAGPCGRDGPTDPKTLVVVPVVRVVPVTGAAACRPLHAAGPLAAVTEWPIDAAAAAPIGLWRGAASGAPRAQQPPDVPDLLGDVGVLAGRHEFQIVA